VNRAVFCAFKPADADAASFALLIVALAISGEEEGEEECQ